jgi:hypothetical protein
MGAIPAVRFALPLKDQLARDRRVSRLDSTEVQTTCQKVAIFVAAVEMEGPRTRTGDSDYWPIFATGFSVTAHHTA